MANPNEGSANMYSADVDQSDARMRLNGLARCPTPYPLYEMVWSVEENGVTNKEETTYGESFNTSLFERMRNMHRAWLGSLREMREIESEFGIRLLAAKTPSEATSICSEWMAKRAHAVASEHQTFATAWLGLISDAITSASAKAGKEPDSDKNIAR